MYCIREWFEMRWLLKTAQERTEALAQWDEPEFQNQIKCERTKHLNKNTTKFWLQNLMEEIGENVSPSTDHFVRLTSQDESAAFNIERKTMQYNYNQHTNEFEPNPTGKEEGDMTGNRVFLTGNGPEARFKVEIDDFADKIAALNRLVSKIVPGFCFT